MFRLLAGRRAVRGPGAKFCFRVPAKEEMWSSLRCGIASRFRKRCVAFENSWSGAASRKKCGAANTMKSQAKFVDGHGCVRNDGPDAWVSRWALLKRLTNHAVAICAIVTDSLVHAKPQAAWHDYSAAPRMWGFALPPAASRYAAFAGFRTTRLRDVCRGA